MFPLNWSHREFTDSLLRMLHGKPTDPYRIFFPLGIVLGAMGVSIWPLYYFGITEGYSGRAHAFVQTIVTQIVKSVRPPDTTRAKMNGTFGDGSFNLGGARVLTVKSFLSANAIRATDSLDYDKIDWCTSNNSVPCALKTITVPLLIVAMQGHYFVNDSEYFLDIARSNDKEFIAIEGATHGFTPCTNCEGGPYNNSMKNLFDYVAKWINARFSN